jgi:hypothetical protein
MGKAAPVEIAAGSKFVLDGKTKNIFITPKGTKLIFTANRNLLAKGDIENGIKIFPGEDLAKAEEALVAKAAAEEAYKQAEEAKALALSDLDILQKKSQTALIGTIVKVALYVIVGVGIITSLMYALAMVINKDTQIIGSTWSNMFGILLTNAFSIVGTLMGVKYASENKNN